MSVRTGPLSLSVPTELRHRKRRERGRVVVVVVVGGGGGGVLCGGGGDFRQGGHQGGGCRRFCLCEIRRRGLANVLGARDAVHSQSTKRVLILLPTCVRTQDGGWGDVGGKWEGWEGGWLVWDCDRF